MMLHILNDVANDAESTKLENYVIMKRESVSKRINRIQVSASLAMSTSVLKALPGKLDIKRHSRSILYLSHMPKSLL